MISNFFKRKVDPSNFITVVSGLPRSGTSMVMKMLQVGGIEPLTDQIRVPDENNPNGYYELEIVKALKDGKVEWLASAPGKSVKVISALLEYLPAEYNYRVIFMQRNMDEILASQKKMLSDRGEPTNKVSDEQMASIYDGHLKTIQTWLKGRKNIQVMYIQYNDLLVDPAPQVGRINRFLGGELHVEDMQKVVDQNLYRQRSPDRS